MFDGRGAEMGLDQGNLFKAMKSSSLLKPFYMDGPHLEKIKTGWVL
jgi:hypothetical protein